MFNAVFDNNIKFISLLLQYSTENNIDLRINDEMKNGNSPILQAIIFNNIEIVRLLINYAEINKIILDINKENRNNDFLLLYATKNKK